MVSVSASDSYFDENPVMTETVGSPVSLRSSSALSPGHDGEPVSVANSLRGKLKMALAKLNLDAPPSETNQAPNLFCHASGQANELVVQYGDFIKELSFGFKSTLTMRPDKVTCMLASMADAGSVGLDSMPPVETVVASLAVQADEALRSEPCCPQPEHKWTDTLVCKTYSALANVGCITNTLAQSLLALNALLPSLDNSGCAEILQVSLQAVRAAASECGRSLGLLTQLRKQVWLAQTPLPKSGKNILCQLPLVPGQVFGVQAQEVLDKCLLASEICSKHLR